MKITKAVAPLTLLAILGLAACGSDDTSSDSSDKADPAVTAAPVVTDQSAAPAASGATVVVGDTDLGQILTGTNGLALYGFTNDVDGIPTCNGGCADAWPPLIVDASLDVSTLPDSATFTLVERADGTMQLKAGDSPLYFFAGDSAPGETNGQGSGGVWFVVGADGTLIS